MDCRPLPFRQLPHQPKLFLEYLDHFEKVKSFYAHPPAMAAVTRTARELDYPDERRTESSSHFREQKVALGGGGKKMLAFERCRKVAVAGVSSRQRGRLC